MRRRRRKEREREEEKWHEAIEGREQREARLGRTCECVCVCCACIIMEYGGIDRDGQALFKH